MKIKSTIRLSTLLALLFCSIQGFGQLLTVKSGETLTVQNGVTLKVEGDLNNPGTISGKGTIEVTGNYAQTGLLEISIGPTQATHTTIDVTGNFTNSGSFTVTNDSYTPASGDQATIVTSGSSTGFDFSNSSNNNWFANYNMPNTGDFTISNSAIILPVELLSFSGKIIAESTQLNWETVSELNNEGFEIQWAMGNEQLAMNSWETLGFVNGSGTTNETQNYQFIHNRPADGINYYRLKQMDFDGKFEYSKIEAVQFYDGQNTPIQIFPNPVKDGNLTIQLDGELTTQMLIQVFDLTGKKRLQQSSFEHHNQLDVSSLSSGIFIVEIVANGQITRKRVVIE